MLGACFMATDMVTSPISPWGMIVFGLGCGIITMVIRLFEPIRKASPSLFLL